MSTPTSPDAELSGWKEIAGYLGVSIRTAQAFEQQHALPIHRMPGTKGRVWTTADELAEWKRASNVSMAHRAGDELDTRAAGDDTGGSHPPSGGAVGLQQAAGYPASRIGRRSLLRYGVVAGGALGLAGMGSGLARLRFKENAPVAGLRVEGSTVIAVARDGGELWRHTFEDGLADSYPTTELSGPPDCLIADVDGDGRDEVLFRRAAATCSNCRRLACFDAFGKVMWEFVPGKTVTDDIGRDFTRPYYVLQFRAVHGRPPALPRVVVNSVHYLSFPTQVAVLDGRTGRLLSEYWHRGHLKQIAVADLDGDGEPEILLAGVNDAVDRKQATLVVFDHRNVRGASCNTKGEPHFQGMSRGTEKKIVFFPRTPASADQEFNLAGSLGVRSERILVTVSEGTNESAPPVAYEFDYSLHVTNTLLTAELVHRYRELQQAGKLPKAPLDLLAIEKALGNAVEVISGKG